MEVKKLSQSESEIVQKLIDAGGETPLTISNFLTRNFLTAGSGRAVIVQTQGEYAVFFLKTDLFNDEGRKANEVKSFLELMALLDYLSQNGYITLFNGTTEKMYFLQNDFDAPKISGKTIVLNSKGFYTDAPDTIHDSNSNVIYKGITFYGDSYKRILNFTSGSIITSENIKDLLNNASMGETDKKEKNQSKSIASEKKVNKSSTKPLWWIVIFLFFLISGMAAIIFIKIQSDENNLKLAEAKHLYLSDTLKSVLEKVDLLQERNNAIAQTAASQNSVYHYGIDISKWNGNEMSFVARADSLTFVICKASEGVKQVDSEFQRNIGIVRSKQLILGVYHFYLASEDPIEQANFFYTTYMAYGKPDIAPIVDIEEASLPIGIKPDPAAIQTGLIKFINHLKEISGRDPIIYTDLHFANLYLVSPTLSNYNLWLADYTKSTYPKIPKTWQKKGFFIWQKIDNYFIDTYATDYDVFYGAKTDLIK